MHWWFVSPGDGIAEGGLFRNAVAVNEHGPPVAPAHIPAFSAPGTFGRLPPAPDGDAAIDLAILGVPFDGLVTYRPGARFGPAAIRQSSVLCRNYSQQMEVSVYERLRSVDAGDVAVNAFDYQETFRAIESCVDKLQDRGAAVVSLGGDHSILVPILRATSRRHPGLTLIQFDAHTDTTDDDQRGQKFHHGTSIRRAIEEGLVEGARVFQIGIRGTLGAASDDDYCKRAGIHRLDMHAYHDPVARADFVNTLHRTAGSGPCYVTFDVDGVDPAFAPGTGTPVAGGLTSYEALDMMAAFRGLRVIGGDVVEVAPAYDSSNITALLGAAVAFEIAALVAIARGN
jgi:agmatinase